MKPTATRIKVGPEQTPAQLSALLGCSERHAETLLRVLRGGMYDEVIHEDTILYRDTP